MTQPDRPLHVLFVAPAYWPATRFGGPIPVMRALALGLSDAGHTVEVLTTSLLDVRGRPTGRTRVAHDHGAAVRYLATPLHYRWMGITPTVPLHLRRIARPDIVHVFGFRDPLGTMVSAWCRRQGVPYVFEALGMFRPKLRKVALKRILDGTVLRPVWDGAAVAIACSGLERTEYVEGGIGPHRIAIRPNGFPTPPAASATAGALRTRLGLDQGQPLVVAAGRVAEGKGLDLLIRALPDVPALHLAIIGPDDGHGTTERLIRMAAGLSVSGRIHLVGELASQDLMSAFAGADVVALASAHENFGMVAAEAAALGRAVLVSDRCGVAELLGERAALVVPYTAGAVRDGLARLITDEALRTRLGEAAADVARQWSWARIVKLQEEIYRRALAA